MRIEEVRTWLVEGTAYNWVLLKVVTDDGTFGIGEATNWPGSLVIEAAVQQVSRSILGKDPMNVNRIYSELLREFNWIGPHGASLCAISGIDMALQDLRARHLGVPLYQMLGGCYRTQIDLYANYWFSTIGRSASEYGRKAAEVADAGFRGIKFDPFTHTDYASEAYASRTGLSEEQKTLAEDIVRAVRLAIGPDRDMMIETHALLTFRDAVDMASRLRPYGIAWFEEPAGPENPGVLEALRKRIDPEIPLCVGERHYTRFGIRELLERHAVDILMPDITRCGGVGEMVRMANLAETYGVPLAPHNPNGPLSTLASAHVAAAIPNFYRLEFIYDDVPWRDTVLTAPLPIKDGVLTLTEQPGLGVDLVEEVLQAHPGIRYGSDKPNRAFYL